MSAKFRAYRNVTFLNIEIPKQCPKGVFGEKIPMARKRKVLAFCLWLNRAGKDVLLGDVLTCFYIKQIVKPGTSFQTRGRIGRLKWRMKCTQSSTNFEASQSFPGLSCIFIATTKEMAMCNDKLAPEIELRSVMSF